MTPNAQILATVGNKTITTADVDAFIAGLGQRGAQFATPDGRKKVLEQLVNNQLFLMDASRNLYEADPVFKAELARAKESILISFAIDKAVRKSLSRCGGKPSGTPATGLSNVPA